MCRNSSDNINGIQMIGELDSGLQGVPARESRTGTRLVSPAAGWEKKNWTPPEQGVRTLNLVH